MTEVAARPDGWISATLDGVDVHVRVGRGANGEPVITDLFMSAPEITTDTMRNINPNRVLAAVNVDLDAVQRAVADAEAVGIEPSPGQQAALEHGWMAGIVTDLEPDDDLRIGELRSRATRLKPRRRRPLGRPTSTGDDAFYRRVAIAYRSASTETGRPAVVLSNENDVPVETVRRWVKEARRRGFLAAGRKGRAI